jgi:hypothetical protein
VNLQPTSRKKTRMASRRSAVGSSMRSVCYIGAMHSRRTGRGVVTSMTPPRVTFVPSSTLAGTPTMSSLPGGRSAKKWKPTTPPATNSLSTTWRLLGNASQKPWNNPPVEKRLPIQRNNSRKPSTGNACAPRRASILLLNVKPFGGPSELRQVYEERQRDYPTNDLLIN